MTSTIALVLVLATVSVSAADLSPPIQIEVFTDRDYPITTQGYMNIDVYRLDTPGRLEQALSAGLPADPVTAKRIVIQRVRKAAVTHARHLQHAYEGLIKAWRYGLDRLPAIVFDGGLAVVYGITDLETALLHYRGCRKSLYTLSLDGRGQGEGDRKQCVTLPNHTYLLPQSSGEGTFATPSYRQWRQTEGGERP